MTRRPQNRRPSGPQRGRDGRFQPGQSGNPGGRPVGLMRAIRRRYGDEGMRLLDRLEAMSSGKTRVPPRIRLEATKELLDRGYGKAPLHVEDDAPETTPRSVRVFFGGRYQPDGTLKTPHDDREMEDGE